MEDKLKWNAIGLVKKTLLLRDYIQRDKETIPVDHTNKRARHQGFLDELNHLIQQMEKIEKILIPKLEKFFRLEFPTPELIMFALSRPSIRTIFDNLKNFFANDPNRPLNDDELFELASSGDAAEVLALIGDAALDLAIAQLFWDSALSNTGKITNMKKVIASNSNLAKFCDEWNLCGCRLNRFGAVSTEDVKPKTIIHEKGTLVESILGVIYLEFGYDVLKDIVSYFQ